MDWNNEKVLEFIQCYETESIIWNPSNPDHKKKYLVHEAWVRIKNMLSWPTTVEEMKKKKDSLMAYYRAHLNKIKKSIKSRADADNIYKTKWFAFSAMNNFLQPIYLNDCSPTIDTQIESVWEERAESDNEVNTCNKEDPIPQLNSKTRSKNAKIDLPSEISHEKRKILEAFEHIKDSDNDEYEMFGKLIASKLRKIKNPNTRDILMNNMHNMVFRACMQDRVNQETV